MKYEKGDIVIVKFPFVLKEGREVQKGRPVLVVINSEIKKRYNYIILWCHFG